MKSRIADITWYAEKCPTPMACKKCIEICQPMVFRSGFYKVSYERGKESDVNEPGRYKISADWLDRCTGCMECIRVCPNDALKVEFRDLEEKRAEYYRKRKGG